MRITIFLFALICSSLIFAQNQANFGGPGSINKLFEMARQYELKPMQKPAWAERNEQPVFTAAWISDLHITNKASLDLVTIACRQIRDTLKPDFTLITGDNCGWSPAEAKRSKSVPASLANLQWFREFLQENLKTPYAIIPGDNWPGDFDKVFGATHRSFDYGGFHFQLAATDAYSPAEQSCAVFKPESLKWMKEDLAANQDKPCLFVMHETLWPPVFLDAQKISGILTASPSVLAALSGHLHLDLDLPNGRWRQLVAPSIGRSHNPAFKRMLFYKDAIIIESYEWRQDKGIFEQASKWQRISVPENLRSSIQDRPAGGFQQENCKNLPAEPKEIRPELAKRVKEVSNALMDFVFAFGVSRFIK